MHGSTTAALKRHLQVEEMNMLRFSWVGLETTSPVGQQRLDVLETINVSWQVKVVDIHQ